MLPLATPLPPDVRELLVAPEFALKLPPMGNGARQLMSLKDTEQEDPRLLALVSQKDPVYLGQLLSLANSAAYMYPGPPVTTAEAAVRRIGVRAVYGVLLACALVASFPEKENFRQQRRVLLNYAVSTCLTAKRLSSWLQLDDTVAGHLNLGSLLSVAGLFAGLLSEGTVAQRFAPALGPEQEGANLRERPALQGFCALSAHVAKLWGAPAALCEALLDSGNAHPGTPEGTLLATVESLVHAKATRQDQWNYLQVVESSFPLPRTNSEQVDLGVFLS